MHPEGMALVESWTMPWLAEEEVAPVVGGGRHVKTTYEIEAVVE